MALKRPLVGEGQPLGGWPCRTLRKDHPIQVESTTVSNSARVRGRSPCTPFAQVREKVGHPRERGKGRHMAGRDSRVHSVGRGRFYVTAIEEGCEVGCYFGLCISCRGKHSAISCLDWTELGLWRVQTALNSKMKEVWQLIFCHWQMCPNCQAGHLGHLIGWSFAFKNQESKFKHMFKELNQLFV